MSTARLLRCLAAAAMLAAPGAHAQALDEDPIDRGAIADTGRDLEQVTGFVVDRTVTNFGAEFFRVFSSAWRERGAAAGADLTVIEKPSARFGSQVFIEQNNRPLVRLFLYAGRSAAIKPLAEEAARYVGEQLNENALAALLAADPDLARDELR